MLVRFRPLLDRSVARQWILARVGGEVHLRVREQRPPHGVGGARATSTDRGHHRQPALGPGDEFSVRLSESRGVTGIITGPDGIWRDCRGLETPKSITHGLHRTSRARERTRDRNVWGFRGPVRSESSADARAVPHPTRPRQAVIYGGHTYTSILNHENFPPMLAFFSSSWTKEVVRFSCPAVSLQRTY